MQRAEPSRLHVKLGTRFDGSRLFLSARVGELPGLVPVLGVEPVAVGVRVTTPVCGDRTLETPELPRRCRSPRAVARFFRDEALPSLARAGAAHNDIGARNVFVDGATGEMKLGDFGVALPLEESKRDAATPGGAVLVRMVCSPLTRPPELELWRLTAARGHPDQTPVPRGYDLRLADAWAAGCVVFWVATGRRAWPHEAALARHDLRLAAEESVELSGLDARDAGTVAFATVLSIVEPGRTGLTFVDVLRSWLSSNPRPRGGGGEDEEDEEEEEIWIVSAGGRTESAVHVDPEVEEFLLGTLCHHSTRRVASSASADAGP